MRVVGLSGGIGSGKSSVSVLLRRRGAAAVDADVLARRVVAPGTRGLAEVVQAFGAELLLPDGTLDRGRLGAHVFSDPAARRRLEEITHPRVLDALLVEVDRAREAGAPLVVFEAALLVDASGRRVDWGLDGLLWVSAERAVRVGRVAARDGLSEAAVLARIAAQVPDSVGRAAADWVIWNEGDPGDLEPQVDAIWPAMIKGATG